MDVIDRIGTGLRRLPPVRGKARATRLGARLLPASACIRRVSDPAGFEYLVDLRSRTEAGVFANGPDDFVGDVLAGLMRAGFSGPDDVVLDIGANVGLVTLPLATAAQAVGSTVVAVEPIPPNHTRLTEAVALNGLSAVVTVVPCGLSDGQGEAEMVVDAEAPTGNAYLRRNGGDALPHYRVALRPLDDVLAESAPGRRASMVKIDVEGAEVLVLSGARRMLTEDRPMILGEFNAGLMPQFGHTFLDAAAILQPLGYRLYAFVAGPRVVPIEPEVGRGDVLWVPDEQAEVVVAAIEDAAATRS